MSNSTEKREAKAKVLDLLSPKAYYGYEAKQQFWDLYKSDRTFKDYDQEKEIKDPRFAYLKECRTMNLLPKASMIIRTEESKKLDYANYRLMKKTKTVAEAIKRYPLEVEIADFQNNGLRGNEAKIII